MNQKNKIIFSQLCVLISIVLCLFILTIYPILDRFNQLCRIFSIKSFQFSSAINLSLTFIFIALLLSFVVYFSLDSSVYINIFKYKILVIVSCLLLAVMMFIVVFISYALNVVDNKNHITISIILYFANFLLIVFSLSCIITTLILIKKA
ncbi:Hypothetical protein, predicted transmembrane protein [Mycoplasmopsis bovigenitalium 51080]|uniref:Transmembrane protein n=1 Tax=Mycoplasmopsis bovigenitalium 51080 TaxID=1188235 RepID=N9VCD4_9BACT|nr:Hypothetical protein, predicted transmembrane protein [Mycoplasmopsis bovigenitalium 51080]